MFHFLTSKICKSTDFLKKLLYWHNLISESMRRMAGIRAKQFVRTKAWGVSTLGKATNTRIASPTTWLVSILKTNMKSSASCLLVLTLSLLLWCSLVVFKKTFLTERRKVKSSSKNNKEWSKWQFSLYAFSHSFITFFQKRKTLSS